MKKRNEDFSIKELVNIFIPRLWLIVILAFLFGIGMAFYAAIVKDNTYTSTTKLHVIKASNVSNSDFEVSDVDFATSYLETYVEVLKITDFLADVLEYFEENHASFEKYEGQYEAAAWDKLTPDRIRGYISATTKQDILSISVQTPDPHLSWALASSIAEVVNKGDTLAYPDGVVYTKTIQVATPNQPDSRRVIINTVIGAVVGAVIAMAIIFVSNLMDVTIHDKKKIEDTFDIPVLGVIPRFMSDDGRAK